LFPQLSLRSKVILGSVAVVIVVAGLVLVSAVMLRHSSSRTAMPATQPTSVPPTAAQSVSPTLNPSQSAGVASDLQLLAAMTPVSAATSASYPALAGPTIAQPDLFARAFAVRLLTQDYQQPRSDLVSWVQAESASSTEPVVVGLVPENLRSKLAAYSVTESSDGSAVPVPSQAMWTSLKQRHAYTTVSVQKVIEPLKWSDAVAEGQLTDPGITEREVDAMMTTHWVEGKAHRSSTQSVALTMNLEGPPVRSGYGFVTAVLYNTVAAG
jgi:hypothetical protein